MNDARVKFIVSALAILLTVVAVAVLDLTRPVLMPLFIAWLISYLVWPQLNYLRRHKIPVPVGITLLTLATLGVCFGLGLLLWQEANYFVTHKYPAFHQQFAGMVEHFLAKHKLPMQYIDQVHWGSRFEQFLVAFSGSFLLFVGNLLIVVVFLFFILLAKPYTQMKLEKAFPENIARRMVELDRSITRQIGHYLFAQFILSVVLGAMVWIALWIIGVDSASTWGILSCLLNFIPTIGPLAATALPALWAFIQYAPNFWPAVIALAALAVIQAVMGNVVSPIFIGVKVNLSPLVILVSILFWAWLWGIVGAFLSIPMTIILKIVCEHIESLKFIAVMLGSGSAMARMEKGKKKAAG